MLYIIPDAALLGGGYNIDTRANAILANIPAVVNFLLTGGYDNVGDGGSSMFKRGVAIVAIGADFQSADGAYWNLVSNGDINVNQFGAKGDNTTEDLVACNLAIDFFNDSNIYNKLTFLPGYKYKITGSLNPFTSNGKYVEATGSTIVHDAGTLFTWGNGVANGVLDGGINGLNYLGLDPSTVGTLVVYINGCNRVKVSNFTGDNITAFIHTNPGITAGGYFLDNVRLTVLNTAAIIIDNADGSNSEMNNVDITGEGINRTVDRVSVTGALATAIRFGTGNWDTIKWNNVLINGFRYGLLVNRTVNNINVSNAEIVNLYLDFCGDALVMSNNATGGGINSWNFVNGYFVGFDGYGVNFTGANGSHRDIKFTNCRSLSAGKNNWRFASQTMDNVSLDNCIGEYANRLNGNAGIDQDDCVVLYGGVTIKNSRFGRSSDPTYYTPSPFQGRYGYNGPTLAANYAFEGNELEGATAPILNTRASTTVTSGELFSASIKNNKTTGGAAVIPYATTSILGVIASGAIQTNNTPFTLELAFYGGTVTSISKNGTVRGDGAGPVSFLVQPGQTWSWVGAVQPTIVESVMP